MCPPDAYSKKTDLFFPGPFFDAFYSVFRPGKGMPRGFLFFPSMHGGNTGNPGCSRCRGSADESASPALLPQEGSDDSPPKDLTGIFHLVFRRTVSHAVFPGMLPGTSWQIDGPTAAITSFASVPNRSCIASSVACPILWTVPRQPECESPIARCTGSTK